jgi:hypothetical protein
MLAKAAALCQDAASDIKTRELSGGSPESV